MTFEKRFLQFIFLFASILILLGGFWLRGHQLYAYPPGLSNDEAINAVDALHIRNTGNFPMYEEDEGRAEPLFRIVEAVGIGFFGRSVWALRFISALLSLPVIALVMWLTREYLADMPLTVRVVAALGAGVAIATMMGHVTLSRTLYRGVLQLVTMSLSVGFVLRGLRRDSWADFALSGFFGGLTLYTYTAAWFFPPSFIVLGLALLVLKTGQWRNWLPQMTVLGVVAVIVCIPVIYLVLTNSRAVFGRAEALTADSFSWISRIEQMIDQFIQAGDENPQYNAHLEPIIPPMFLTLFYVGLGGFVVRIRRPETWFLASLLILMALPAMLSEEITHGLRVAGEYMVVPVVVGAGVGLLVWAIHKIAKLPRVLVSVGAVLVLGAGVANGIRTWERYTYFFDNPTDWRLWAVHDVTLDHNEWFFRIDREDFGVWLTEQTTPMLIPIEELNRQTTRSWIMGAYPFTIPADDDFTIPDDTMIVLPYSLERGDLIRETRQYALLADDTITILPPMTEQSHDALIATAEDGDEIRRDGLIDFLGYVAPITPEVVYESPVVNDEVLATFGNGDLNLVGWYGERTLDAGTVFDVSLIWESNRLIGHEYTSSVQIQTQDYEFVAGNDLQILRWVYPTSIWQEDVPISVHQSLPVPDELDAGAYRLTVGLFYASAPLIKATSDTSSVLDERVTFAWLKVAQDTPDIPETANPVDVTFADSFALTHIEFADVSGQLLGQLHWEGLVDRPTIDATIFVHIVDGNGTIVAQSDTRPQDGQYPTFIWDAGEVIQTNHGFSFSDFENLDDYTVRVGMYIFPGPVNLEAVYQGDVLTDGLVNLGQLSEFVTAP